MIFGDEFALDHLDRMTDSTGLIQHAIYSIPRRESGYTTDDNARALRLCVRLWSRRSNDRMLNRVATYLSFLEYARNSGGCFHNFMSYERRWLDTEGCGDCQGQAVLALAEVAASNLPDDFRHVALELIESALPPLADLRSLRAQAYIIQAWSVLWSAGASEATTLESVAWSASRRLVEAFGRATRPDWKWFEGRMTYANAVLPHALFQASQRWPKESYREIAETSFAFLDQATTADNVFWPIGNDGWYAHGYDKALYDQQPVEASTMAEAALAAFALVNDSRYLATFRRARDWFHGKNSLGLPLVDLRHGGCYDGLQHDGVNRNQGAESTLAFLWTAMRDLEYQGVLSDAGSQAAATA